MFIKAWKEIEDDTVLIYKLSLDCLLNIKRVLKCFQAILRLKINFHKNYFFEVGVNQHQIGGYAERIRCKPDTLLTTYLGLPLEGRVNSLKVWQLVVEKFESKLFMWKSRYLSMKGKLTFLKSILRSLPIFLMSILQILVSIKEKLARIQRSFFFKEDQWIVEKCIMLIGLPYVFIRILEDWVLWTCPYKPGSIY
ncbi:Uncharacterized protein TCM_024189 [Theobroma cacao]|uniref:Uncharacterized protein n=1 Tax=Theobroma cacao TaxID=3641 RepID=A0A061EUZ6_THECC|nr:Uncharacterized protein TCM_024189 [Theobroma cacao]